MGRFIASYVAMPCADKVKGLGGGESGHSPMKA